MLLLNYILYAISRRGDQRRMMLFKGNNQLILALLFVSSFVKFKQSSSDEKDKKRQLFLDGRS